LSALQYLLLQSHPIIRRGQWFFFMSRASPAHVPVKAIVRFGALLCVCIASRALAFWRAAIV